MKQERVVRVKDKVFGHVQRDEHRRQDGRAVAQEVEQVLLLYEANRFRALE